jgi:hypothetical protein
MKETLILDGVRNRSLNVVVEQVFLESFLEGENVHEE